MALQMPDERLGRLEQLGQIIAEGQISLQKLIAELATETRRGFDQVAAQFRETHARIDQLAHEGAERSRTADERVDRLVLAIGEMIRRQDSGAKQ